MICERQRPTQASLVGSLLLAVLHYSAGIAILLLASWFIAACAIAGVNFNYVLPAVVIRALALLRIGSGYFSLLVGHHDLLLRLANLRDRLFAALEGQTEVIRSEALDAMNHNSERVAAVWMAFVAQNSGILFSLTLLNVISLFYIPALSLIVLYFSVSFFILYALMLVSLLGTAAKIVALQRDQQLNIHQHIESASLWHMQAAGQVNMPSLNPVRHALNLQHRRIKLMSLILLLLSITSISVLFTHYSHTMLGNAMFIIVPMVLLGVNDWLTPSLPSQQTLLEYVQAKRSLNAQLTNHQRVPRLDNPVHAIDLTHFKASKTQMPTVSTYFAPCSLNVIVGSSGTGKSRLLQAIAGLIPSTGTRSLRSATESGQQESLPQGVLNNILYVEQFPYCLSDTLLANLQLANQQASQTQVKQALRNVGLAYLDDCNEWLGDAGRTLSGGEKKRLGIARALLSDAAVILIDEPFEGLDAKNTSRIAEQISLLAQTKTVVLSTHIIPSELVVDSLVSLDTLSSVQQPQQQVEHHDGA